MGIPRKEVEKLIGHSLDAPAKPKTPVPKSKYRSKSEAAYALQLEARWRVGEIYWWKYEAITFRLAKRLRYTPDFFVVTKDYKYQFHEVKRPHRHRRVGLNKFKVACEMFPWFQWVLVES